MQEPGSHTHSSLSFCPAFICASSISGQSLIRYFRHVLGIRLWIGLGIRSRLLSSILILICANQVDVVRISILLFLYHASLRFVSKCPLMSFGSLLPSRERPHTWTDGRTPDRRSIRTGDDDGKDGDWKSILDRLRIPDCIQSFI